MPRSQHPPTLTVRDIALLKLVAARRGIPIELLAAELFDVDPFTGLPNANPLRACERRVRALVGAGYLTLVRQNDGRRRRQIVVAANGANDIACRRASTRRAPSRSGAHHVRTQDAVAGLARSVERRGGRVVAVRFEDDLRAEAQKGHRVRRGDLYASFPDAVCSVEMPGLGKGDIAVEYVTSKYTNADIEKKHRSFDRFHAVVWVADRARTVERVTALTGRPCTILT